MRFILLLISWVCFHCFSAVRKRPRSGSRKRTVGTQAAEALRAARLTESAPEYIAAVRANEETDFSFKVGGIVELIGPEPRRDWEEGAPVQRKTVLARLQQGDFKNALASAKAAAELAAANVERLRKLVAGKVVSKQEAGKGQSRYRNRAEPSSGRRSKNCRDSELRAPWDGVVFTRYVNSGETVNSGKPVLRFGDIRTMSVELGVPDRLVGSVRGRQGNRRGHFGLARASVVPWENLRSRRRRE